MAATTTSNSVDESLWWDSFVALFEELDAASDLSDHLAKKVKSNQRWFLDSVTRFKVPNRTSRLALDSPKISVGSRTLVVKPELKEAALHASSCWCLDEVQSYILFDRFFELNDAVADAGNKDLLNSVLLHYYFERQCLMKCIRRLFVHTLCMSDDSSSNDPIVEVALELVHDGLERKLLAILNDLLSSATSEKSEVDFTVLWVEESIIESNLVLDTLFLLYYDNLCSCSGEQWKRLSSLFKDILCGSYSIGKFAVSLDARTSFDHAKSQLLLILIETLDLENLLRMVHDEVPYSKQGGCVFSLSDVPEMDNIVSSISVLGMAEAGPLLLAWAVCVRLLLSLPDGTEYDILLDIDHIAYLHQAFEATPFDHLLEILRSSALRNSDGPVSGYLSILRTLLSAFIASYELNYKTAGSTLNLILDILSEIYHGEESLSMQFWDKDSFVDGPVRSLLYMLESEYPFQTVELVSFLSALCSGNWSAECVFNFLEKMTGITMLSEFSGGSQFLNSYDVIEAENQLDFPAVEGLVIPKGTRGQILKVFDANVALVRWEFVHSGILLLLLRIAQMSSICSYDEVSVILDLLDRMVSSNTTLGFTLLFMEKSLPTHGVQKNQHVQVNVRIDFVKIICGLAFNLVHDVNNAHVVSMCIHILAKILKCAPCHVMEVVSRSNIFGAGNNSIPSNTCLFSGELARMLLADCESNEDCSRLILSVLDFTIQLVENGGEDNLVSALVVFSFQHVLVNHIHWKYKCKYARWQVTLKVLEVLKSCITAIQVPHKLASMIRGILFFDSSIHSILCQILCISPAELERSNINRNYELKDIECFQLAVCSVLEVVYSMVADFSKETALNAPTFLLTMLSSTAKPIPIVRAAVPWINFFNNSSIQVAAAKVFSILCALASTVQPYRIDNISLVDSIQIRELSTSIFRILNEDLDTNEELLICIFDLLSSAAVHQPAVLVSLLLTEDSKVAETTAGGNSKQHGLTSVTETVRSEGESIVDLILKYVKKSEIRIKSVPRLVFSALNLLKALWEGGIQYLHILEKIRSSELFWKNLSSTVLSTELKINLSVGNLNDSDVQCATYRYWCEGMVMEIFARELFLQEKVLPNDILGKQASTGNSNSKSSASDILLAWCGNSTFDNLVKFYSPSGYDKGVVLHAKMSVCLCIVHLIITLTTGNSGSLSISVVEKINNVSLKIRNHPAFSALLAQYSSHGYSEGNELTCLVLNDLYYHMQGELEGRQITQGPFQELSQVLLELETYQNDLSNYEWCNGPHCNYVTMFNTTQARKELGVELWDYSGWNVSKKVAERMLLHMGEANLIMSLSDSKCSALKALISLISVYNRNVIETKSAALICGISRIHIVPNIKYLCKCLQAIEDSLVPALRSPEILLEILAAQAELLLVLSIILFRQTKNNTDKKQYLPVCLLLISTSGSSVKKLADVRPSSTVLNTAVKSLLTLLLASVEFLYLEVYAKNSDFEIDQFADVTLASIGLIPILSKYVENAEYTTLSVASIDLMLKGFMGPNTWLPILERHLQLHYVVQKVQQKDTLISIPVILNFLLTLARTKAGAHMLYSSNIFSSLKVLFSYSLNDSDGNNFSTILNNSEKQAQLWGLCLAIITSMLHSLGEDPSCTDILDSVIRYFFSEKYYIVSHYLSMPSLSSDDNSNKRKRDNNTNVSLASLILTENTLALVCMLVEHPTSWNKYMKEMNSELRETCIHLLAFVSKCMHKSSPLFCPPTTKEDVELNGRPSFARCKHGWFRVCAIGIPVKTKASAASNTEISQVTRDQPNGIDDMVQSTHFSDAVAIQMYRITFLLLKFLCMQAKNAAKRAEELEFIDLAYFPELPMPEIMHGLQDQAISIITEISDAHQVKSLQPEAQGVCLLLLQILEKTLYLELSLSQSCGIRPVLGRMEDFSKQIKALMHAVEKHSIIKLSLRSLGEIIALVYPGLVRSGSLI